MVFHPHEDLLLLEIVILVTFDAIAVFTLIFFERRDPESVVAWLFAIITLPILGFVLYLVFGFKYFKSRAFGLKSTGDREILTRVRKGLEPGIPDETEHNLAEMTEYPDLARL
ncbi:MAG TPA: PLDc N-terminal domain-containing protein, partial [Thermoplasmata archaeon]|nr:PLDc N-terminal domain-containing protein [Thermoplasmata archaeon]